MVSSLPDLPPPLSFICIIGILIVYIMCCYLVIDFISQDEEENIVYDHHHQASQMANDRLSYSHISVEELQEITCLYHKVGENFSTCAICLENLRQAEVCRVLPACRHKFHAQCIDPWLLKRLNCPVCRAPFRRSFCA